MKLLDVGEFIIDCPHSTAPDEGSGFPLIRTPNIGKGRLTLDRVQRVSFETYNTRNVRAVPQANDLILAREAPVGNVAIIKEGQQVCLGQRTVLIRPNKNIVDPDFLTYYLLSPYLQHLLLVSSNGATVSHLNMSAIRDLEIALPPLGMQRKIGKVLSNIDDKIEANEKINKNLQQQIDALYDAFFVSFSAIDNPMVDSELGPMPEGWRVVELKDVTENVRERVGSENYRVLSAINTGVLQPSDEYFTKQVYSKDISKYICVRENDIAYNPARVNIGSIGINDLGYIGCVSPVYVVVRPQPDYEYFLKYFIKTQRFQEEVKVRASGSVRQAMNYTDFGLIKVIYPPRDVVREFNSEISALLGGQAGMQKENEQLSLLRDYLLPRLMSGELDVSNVEI